MTPDVTLRIGEIRVEVDPGAVDVTALERALEAAFAALAERVAALLAGRQGVPEAVVIPDILIRDEAAKALLASRDFQRLTDAIFAELETKLGVAP
jgi:hypothetical protein